MNRVELLPQAQRDLDDIFDFIYQDKPSAAAKELGRLRRVLELLGKQPLFGQRRDDLRTNLRLFSARQYVVAYYPRNDGIDVVTTFTGPGIGKDSERGER